MDGIIVINKPKGCTSHDIVYKVKKITGEKVGHTGTLDPNATGVLPLLIGKGTLLSKYLINHDKTYEVTLKLGEKKDTADVEGNTIETKKVNDLALEKENIIKILNSFVGKQEQIPPMYSAIKVNGKKLYEYARNGESVEVKPRKIEIYNIKLINIDKTNKEIDFEVSCSKGTYIRSLCEAIAEKFGTVGYMENLKRTQVGIFNIDKAITVQELENNIENNEYINKNLISIENIFKSNFSIDLDSKNLRLFLNGVKIKVDREDAIYKIYDKNSDFIGTGTVRDKILKRDIIIKNIEKN